MDAIEQAAVHRARAALELIAKPEPKMPLTSGFIGLSSREIQRYSLFTALRALDGIFDIRKFEKLAGFEFECSRAVAKSLRRDDMTSILIPSEILQRPLGDAATRAMASNPGTKGGYLIGVENLGFIDILRARSVALNMGARLVSGLKDNCAFSRQTGKATVSWQGVDGTSVGSTDQALGQLSMTPKTAIAITDVSMQLLRQLSPSAEQFFMADLAKVVAIDGLDNAVINGVGGAQPLGIKNTTGIASGQDSASATYAKLLAFLSVAGTANAIGQSPGWVANTAAAILLMGRQRFTSTDSPLWEGNVLDGTICKSRAMSSEQLATGNLIFGSWDEVVIGEWGVLELDTDAGGTRFNSLQVGIRAKWLVDVVIRHPAAFVVSTNLS